MPRDTFKKSHCHLAVLLAIFALLGLAIAAQAQDDERRVERNVIKIEECLDDNGEKIPCTAHFFPHRGGFLGVSLTDLTPELRTHFGVDDGAGVMISKIVEESPAAEAGLRVGDIVTRVGGEEMSSAGEVAREIRAVGEGESVEIEYYRDGRLEQLTAWPEQREHRTFDMGHMLPDLGKLEFDFPNIEIDEEAIERSLEHAQRYLESDEFKRQMERVKEIDLEEMERRMEEVQKRLEEVERQIEREMEREFDNRNDGEEL